MGRNMSSRTSYAVHLCPAGVHTTVSEGSRRRCPHAGRTPPRQARSCTQLAPRTPLLLSPWHPAPACHRHAPVAAGAGGPHRPPTLHRRPPWCRAPTKMSPSERF